jgi:hypothetical protein
VKLRADPLGRLCIGVLGLGLIMLASEWVRIVLASVDPFWLDDIPRADLSHLLTAAIVGVPLAALGGVWAVRAAKFGVTCTETVVKVHGLHVTRRIPTSGVLGVRRGVLGGVYLRWEDGHGWPHSTKIGAFSVSPFARRPPVWLGQHNARCIAALEEWTRKHAGAG